MSTVKERSWFGRLFAKKAEPEDTRDYHAVVIRIGRDPCQAVQANYGERVLSAEARLLPLKDCDRPERCSCRYQHYDDRRDGPRRAKEQGMSGEKKADDQAERRYVKGRRADDAIEDDPPVSVHEDSYYQHAEDTARTAILNAGVVEEAAQTEGVDPYNSGSFDKSKNWKSSRD